MKRIAVFVLRDTLRFDALRIRTNWKVEYKPVTDLKLYSGGEKLMATLLLFFLSVRIGMETRQGNEGRARAETRRPRRHHVHHARQPDRRNERASTRQAGA